MLSEEEQILFKLNIKKYNFENVMSMSMDKLLKLSEEKRNEQIRKFNTCCSKVSGDDMDWLKDCNDNEKKADSSKELKENKFLLGHNANYYINKIVPEKSHYVNYNDIPENTAIHVVQAKHVIMENKYAKKNSNEMKGQFILTCRVVGQVLPAKEGTPLSMLTQSTILKEVKKISNPRWIVTEKGTKKFEHNKLSHLAYFKTCFDKTEDEEDDLWWNFGTEEVEKNEALSTVQGRFERKVLPIEFETFSNASLYKLISSSDPSTIEPLVFYRQFKSDPCHRHNVGRNKKACINFIRVPAQKIQEFGFVTKDDNNNMVPTILFDDSSRILLKGDTEAIDMATKCLIYILDLSYSDYCTNLIHGRVAGVPGSAFKVKTPTFLAVNEPYSRGRSDKHVNQSDLSSRGRSRSPLKRVEDKTTADDEVDDDDDEDNEYGKI